MPARAPKNGCERVVGRLVEIHVDAGYRSPADVDAMIAMLGRTLAAMTAPEEARVLIAADWRRCTILGTDTAERAAVMLAGVNPRVLRSSMLVLPDSPTAVMQALRLVKESNNTWRRVFTAAADLIAWNAEVMTPAEVERLKVFLERRPSLGP
jgi:hypothetical protein